LFSAAHVSLSNMLNISNTIWSEILTRAKIEKL